MEGDVGRGTVKFSGEDLWISSWDYQTKRGETARLCELSRSETFHGARREGNSIELRNEFEFASGLWIAEEF